MRVFSQINIVTAKQTKGKKKLKTIDDLVLAIDTPSVDCESNGLATLYRFKPVSMDRWTFLDRCRVGSNHLGLSIFAV